MGVDSEADRAIDRLRAARDVVIAAPPQVRAAAEAALHAAFRAAYGLVPLEMLARFLDEDMPVDEATVEKTATEAVTEAVVEDAQG